MDADRRSILSAVDHEMGLARREIVAFSGLAGVGALLATIGHSIGEARAQSAGSAAEGDLKILNVALGLEHEAIAESKLLDKPILETAVLFQSQHKAHRDALAATIKRAGGTPIEPRKLSDYAWPRLASQTDVLLFAAKLEAGAASAYLGALRAIENKEYLTAAASIMGNETQHLALLRQVLKENPVPTAFIG
jgi:Ferritin-like domain